MIFQTWQAQPTQHPSQPAQVAATGISPSEQATARVLITAVLHRYASLGRENCAWEISETLFEPNGLYRLADGRELPRWQLKQVVRGNEAKYIRHLITSIDIQFESATEAHIESCFFAATEYAFNDHWGRWRDIFRRQVDGSWKFKERTIVLEDQDPNGWTARVYGNEGFKTNNNNVKS